MGGKNSSNRKNKNDTISGTANGQGTQVSQSDLQMNIEDNSFINKLQTGPNQKQAPRKKQSQLKTQAIQKENMAYERMEARIPLQVMDIREFEGRLKKLVYGKETISLRQLTYKFARDFEDFEDLTDSKSTLTKIMTSSVFKQNPSDSEMNIQYLMLFGLLYCQGTLEEKSKCLYDVLQDGLQELIAASDKDLKDCFWRLIEMTSVVIHEWSQLYGDEDVRNNGLEPFFNKNEENQEKWAEIHETLMEQFLDTVFDMHTRLKREEFIQNVTKKAPFIFKPKEIRKKIKSILSGK